MRVEPSSGYESADSLVTTISGFIRFYREAIVRYHEKHIDGPLLEKLSGAITTAIEVDRNTIFAFGNGGSHAITRHLERSLKLELSGSRLGIRIDHGIDFHAAQAVVCADGYDQIFVDTLMNSQANADDLVILITGSGNSSNLLRAAEYCRERGIRTISMAGFDGGEITRKEITDIAIVIDIHDQQMSEDIIQQTLHIVARCTRDRVTGCKDSATMHKRAYVAALARGLDLLSGSFLNALSDSVTEAFLDERHVFVLAPEGDGLSISAEHIAHNLNWDAVFEIADPPRRNISSTPTSCDFSGIGNDRLMPGVVSCQQLDKARPDDVLVLNARDSAAETVRNTLRHAKETGMIVYLLAGHDSGQGAPDCPHVILGTDSSSIVADLVQMTGHILGRLVHMKLKQRLQQSQDIGPDSLSYLVECDLAQRRLLHAVHGV